MHPLDDGEFREEHTHTVLYCSRAPDQRVLESLETWYQVKTAASPEAVTEQPDAPFDCLVVDGELYSEVDSNYPHPIESGSIPVIVFAEQTDPALVQSVARRPEADLVYRDTGPIDQSVSESERLRERIDAACRDRSLDLDAAVLELAGLLMSAAPDEVDTRIQWGLRSIGETLQANRCVLYDSSDETLGRIYEWAEMEPLSHGQVPNEEFPGFESAIGRFDSYVTVVDSESNQAKALGYDRGSFVAIPVVIGWALEWVLTFGGVPSENVTESTLTRLKTFAELLGHTLRRDRRLREIERQNERLERFASVIRHDLQNPLNVISGFADLAKDTQDPADIDRISMAATRMEAILEDLHTLVHEADDLGDREPTMLSALVDRARSTVDMKDATVETADVGVIETDPGRLRQVFENLFRNAVEHGGSDVSVRIRALEDGFAIADDGPGIPETEREAVFEEGYTAGDGSGLGLSIVRTIIEAHGWDVSITESTMGGARFEITGVQFVDAARVTATH